MKQGKKGGGTEAHQAGNALNRWHGAGRSGVPLEELRDDAFRTEYPFESHIHDLSGLNYHYVDEGEGEPVVMVHGNPTWSFFYRGLVKDLRSSHRCLAPDHIGCGFSEKPQKYDYTLEQHIINLEAWLEAVLPPPSVSGGKINLIVHDWGGPIGLGYAIRHPERISRVVIFNTSAFTAGDMPFSIKICRWPLVGPFLVRGMNLFATEASKRTTVKPLSRNVRSGFLMPYNSWSNRIAILRFVQDIPLVSDTPTHGVLHEIENYVGDILTEVPVLIQWGMEDWCFSPFFLDLWKKRFPRAEIDEYQAGHYLLEDAGTVIYPRIRQFLGRTAT